MTSMRFLLFALLALLLATSCRKETISAGDGLPPTLKLRGKAELRDTFKLGPTPRYSMEFEIQDDQSDWTLSVNGLQDGLLYFQDKIVNDRELDLAGAGKGVLEFRALKAGAFSFIVEVKDAEQRGSSVLVDLLAIDNWLPVARLQGVQTDSLAPGQIRLDASGSFDQDARWGGKIARYEYTIGDFYQAVVSRPQLNYILPEPGTYRISLRVQDNDQGWSEPIVQNLLVE